MDLRVGGTLKLLYMTVIGAQTRLVAARTSVSLQRQTQKNRTLGLQASDAFQTKLYWNTPPPSADLTSHTETVDPTLKIGIATTHRISIFSELALDTYLKDGVELHAGAEWTLFDLSPYGLGSRSGVGVWSVCVN